MRAKVEAGNHGKVVAIDIETGAYALGENALASAKRLRTQASTAFLLCLLKLLWRSASPLSVVDGPFWQTVVRICSMSTKRRSFGEIGGLPWRPRPLMQTHLSARHCSMGMTCVSNWWMAVP